MFSFSVAVRGLCDGLGFKPDPLALTSHAAFLGTAGSCEARFNTGTSSSTFPWELLLVSPCEAANITA